MSILQTIDLKKYYGTEPNITRALNGVIFTVEQGEVVSVSPSEGAEVKEGTTVTLVISKGNQPATVPKLTGKSQSDAEAALSQAGLSGNATEDYSDTVEEGVIISQDTDAGKEVSKGTTIG